MISGPTVVVLMATYNGEKYIKRQIDSILNQTYRNIKIIISDDGSTDETYSVLKNYERRFSNISVIKNAEPGSPKKNFNNLIRYALNTCDDDYYMFSDQDDNWYSNKVEIELSKMFEVEKKEKSQIGLLIYSNYMIVKEGETESKPAYKNEIAQTPFSRLIMQTWPMGCTMMINRTLLLDAGECPKEVPNHDEWIALIASINGKIDYIHKCTMDHVLHDNNATTRLNTTSFVQRIKRTRKRIKDGDHFFKNKMELTTILIKKNRAGMKSHLMIEKYRDLLCASSIKTLILMIKYDFHSMNLIEDIIFLLAKKKYKGISV